MIQWAELKLPPINLYTLPWWIEDRGKIERRAPRKEKRGDPMSLINRFMRGKIK